MFEQSVVRPGPIRGWAVTLAFASNLLAVACALAVPLLWPQLLPRAELFTAIFAPSPAPAPVKQAVVTHVRPTREWIRDDAILYTPVSTTIAVLEEPPTAAVSVIGATGSEGSSPFTSLLNQVTRVPEPRRPVEPVQRAVTPVAPAAPQQIHVTSKLQAARLVERVQPTYPVLAVQTHTSGTVELAGVIGTDGRIRELRVVSGHPLLIRAAVDAVRQWVYRPTYLGGQPVEVVTTIQVIFRLQ